jgi:hypothetical protein
MSTETVSRNSGAREALETALSGLDLDWTVLGGLEFGSPPDEVGVDFLALHPRKGVAIIDAAPGGDPAASERFAALLRSQGFSRRFNGHLPIVHLRLDAAAAAQLPERLEGAFDGSASIGVRDPTWVDALASMLAEAPAPGPAAVDPVRLDATPGEKRIGAFIEAEPRVVAARPPARRRRGTMAAMVALLVGIGVGYGAIHSVGPEKIAAYWRGEPAADEISLAGTSPTAADPAPALAPPSPAPAETAPPAPKPPVIATPSPAPSPAAAPPLPAAALPAPAPPPPVIAAPAPPPKPAEPPAAQRELPSTAAIAPPAPAREAEAPRVERELPPIPAAKPTPPEPPPQMAAPEPSRAAPPQTASRPAEPPRPLAPPPSAQRAAEPPREAARPGARTPEPPRPAPPAQTAARPPARQEAARPETPRSENRPIPLRPGSSVPRGGPPLDARDLPPLETASAPAASATEGSGASGGGECRPYTAETSIMGQPRVVSGVACRQPDGRWKLVTEQPAR